MTVERVSLALRRSPLNIVIAFIAFIWLLPSVGLLMSSLRPEEAVISTGWWTVLRHPFDFTQLTLSNYASVITEEGMGRAFLNSLIISIPSTIIPITVAAFAAYAFSWMDFPGREWIFVVVVGLLVVPLQMTLIPILRIYNRLGLAGTFAGIWLAHTGYGLPYAVYLLRNFIGALPQDLLESAFLDGASHVTAFLRLVIPLSIPAIASIAIFQFLWVWNDLLVALVYLGGTEAVAPVTLKMSSLVNSLGQDWHLLTAAAFVTMILPLAVFFALQRYFVRGILAGSVKG
jgi:alpha-glucoside transport system permease protein